MRLYALTVLLPMFLCTCAPAPLDAQFPYDVDEPELLADMPDILEEISGLDLKGDELIAIQDEDGIIFRIDRHSGKVLQQIDFWKEGDYEGVEFVGDAIWVTKSNGNLYEVTNAGTDAQEVTEHKTWLKGENDVEGLCYDEANHRLLLACKDDPKGNGLDKENRYIFAYDLETHELLEDPVVTIPRLEGFAPSALAIHPRSGELYLTSSQGKQLLVTAPDGRVKMLMKLDKDLFPQPEGLTFAPDGTLYISTEAGRGLPGRIYRLPLAP